ncbi:MAG: hypothetical protein LBM16_02530 [Clostridiales bacterium]|jgi:hypothetical protein|nr:hypothetical protein [Clostridiales bacterium]
MIELYDGNTWAQLEKGIKKLSTETKNDIYKRSLVSGGGVLADANPDRTIVKVWGDRFADSAQDMLLLGNIESIRVDNIVFDTVVTKRETVSEGKKIKEFFVEIEGFNGVSI